MFNSLQPHEPQHARPSYPSPTLRIHPNPCLLSRWCHPIISSSVIPFSSCLQSFQASGFFPMGQLLCIRWPKYCSFSFSISPSSEYSVLISFRVDWLDLPEVQGSSQECSLTPQFRSINSSALRFLYGPTLTYIHEYWKNHSLD